MSSSNIVLEFDVHTPCESACDKHGKAVPPCCLAACNLPCIPLLGRYLVRGDAYREREDEEEANQHW
jgi:hypothetical protein